MIQFMPANHSNTNRVMTILIHSDKTLFQNVFVTLLRRVAKDVTSSLLTWHKRYDFNAANFRRHSQSKCALQTQWIRMTSYSDFSTDQTFHRYHDLDTVLDLHRIKSGFHGAFATGAACQQGTLILPDTWFRPPFWNLLFMLQLLRLVFL